MAQLIKLTAMDGSPVEFMDEVIGSGAMKDVYFSPDKSYVVGFFRTPQDANSVDRLKNITGVYREDSTTGVAAQLLDDEYFDGDEIQAMLQEAITSLPEKQRAIFNMRYFDEMKYTDMSEILGTSVGALKASYHIAVKKISEYFKQRD